MTRLPSPYNTLDTVMPFHDHGWLNEPTAIERLLSEIRPARAVEVGSWLGKTSIFLARRLPASGTLFCVDTWDGSEEHRNNPDWAALLPTLYQQFLSNVVHAQLTDVIVPLRMTSLEAARELTRIHADPFDFVYIDADHSCEAVSDDCNAWWPLVRDGGILAGDDWTWGGVHEAVNLFCMIRGLTPEIDRNLWTIRKRNGG